MTCFSNIFVVIMRFLVLTISSLHFDVTNNVLLVVLSVTTAVAGVCVCACVHACRFET